MPGFPPILAHTGGQLIAAGLGAVVVEQEFVRSVNLGTCLVKQLEIDALEERVTVRMQLFHERAIRPFHILGRPIAL